MSSTKERILTVVERSDKDLSIGEIAEKSDLSRETVSKYVNVLQAQGKIKLSRKVGHAKLYEKAD